MISEISSLSLQLLRKTKIANRALLSTLFEIYKRIRLPLASAIPGPNGRLLQPYPWLNGTHRIGKHSNESGVFLQPLWINFVKGVCDGMVIVVIVAIIHQRIEGHYPILREIRYLIRFLSYSSSLRLQN